MEMTGLQIFKYMPAAQKLPHSNCKKCGCPTCMVYSLKLAKQQIEIDKCPYVCEELRQNYLHSIKHPQKIVKIGDLEIGGENVLFRHEKTFINPTVLAVVVDCSKPDYKEKIKNICEFRYSHVGEIFGVDLIVLKNNNKAEEKLFNELNYVNFISFEELQKLDLNVIEEQDFQTTKNFLIETRTKAIVEKDENASAPVCVLMKNDNIFSQAARSGFYLCKYANMLLFEDFDTDLFSTLITLRHNIFTNPQSTLQVEPGLYKYNNPDENSIVFMTTNFALTYFSVSNELENLNVPSYLIIVPAEGMSVLTAWSAQTFTPQIVSKFLNEIDLKNKINTRKIIIPGLVSDMLDELNKECSDFEFVEGSKDASDIQNFVKNYIAPTLG